MLFYIENILYIKTLYSLYPLKVIFAYQQLFPLKDTRIVAYHTGIKKIEVNPFLLTWKDVSRREI